MINECKGNHSLSRRKTNKREWAKMCFIAYRGLRICLDFISSLVERCFWAALSSFLQTKMRTLRMMKRYYWNKALSLHILWVLAHDTPYGSDAWQLRCYVWCYIVWTHGRQRARLPCTALMILRAPHSMWRPMQRSIPCMIWHNGYSPLHRQVRKGRWGALLFRGRQCSAWCARAASPLPVSRSACKVRSRCCIARHRPSVSIQDTISTSAVKCGVRLFPFSVFQLLYFAHDAICSAAKHTRIHI